VPKPAVCFRDLRGDPRRAATEGLRLTEMLGNGPLGSDGKISRCGRRKNERHTVNWITGHP
jgi:hypothetical protein